LASHTLDNRPGVNSLKFEVYKRFGVVDYDSEIHPYLIAKDKKNGNAFNQIYELLKQPGGEEKLLTYNGWDSICSLRAGKEQMEEIGYDFLPF
ncbi:MAG: hypothetical protein KGY70_20850, partial [Bacteroidales bacterium]|nr:hypothetical protein [Bacteroidales bacterium]